MLLNYISRCHVHTTFTFSPTVSFSAFSNVILPEIMHILNNMIALAVSVNMKSALIHSKFTGNLDDHPTALKCLVMMVKLSQLSNL